ncbi:Uncharacterised protein [Clostridioides difficile]|nr:Uncharacterised protein [Clostridioides difficile]VHT46394.1 Uncharacterised protein [Clostridioides difficile]
MNLEKNSNDDIEDIVEKRKRLIIPFLMVKGVNEYSYELN